MGRRSQQMTFLDTNVIVRFILADDPQNSPKARSIVDKIARGETKVFLPAVIIAETVYVLLKVYKLKREKIQEKLLPLIMFPGITTENKNIYSRVFETFVSKNVDFEDAYQVVLMHKKKIKEIYSFDHDFDKFSQI